MYSQHSLDLEDAAFKPLSMMFEQRDWEFLKE